VGITVEAIAAALVAALNDAANDAEFTEEFTATWDYVRVRDYTEYTTAPEVLVIPRIEENEPEDRADNRYTLGCGIAVIRKVADTEKETIQPLLTLPRSIRDFLKKPEYRTMAGAEWKNTTFEILYGHDELKNDATLVSIINTEYWVIQE